MAEKDIKLMNKKYARQRVFREAVSAWLFLLPNFIGFMCITFLPIFGALLLAFTEWDGTSAFLPKPESVQIAFRREGDLSTEVRIPKGQLMMFNTTNFEKEEDIMSVRYVLSNDIVIPPNTVEYGFDDIMALLLRKSSSTVDTNNVPILSIDLTKVNQDDIRYMNEKSVFVSPFRDLDAGSLGLRMDKAPVNGLGISINMKKKSHEVCFTLPISVNPTVIPRGTAFFGDITVKKLSATNEKEWGFVLDRDVVLKPGESELKRPIELWATNGGLINMQVSNVLLLKPEIKGVVAFVKLLGSDLRKNPAGIKGGSGNDGMQIVGLKNFYKLIVKDTRFRIYMLNTLIFLLQIPLGMALSLIMALAMNQPLKGIVVFRILYFLPVISNLVAISLLWLWLLNPDYGLINNLLASIGIMNGPKWLSDSGWAKVSIIIVEVWKGAGYNMMLYLAGLQSIDHTLYEAAEIDGASSLQQFWSITWPLLGPTNFFILINGIIGGFQAFGTQYIMMRGGPAGATTTIVYYIYNNAYQWMKMGYATAIAMILLILIMVVTIINWMISEKQVEY